MRRPNKNYKIYRFDVYAQISKSKDEDFLLKLRWEYAEAYTQFKMNLIDTFCAVPWKTLNLKYVIPNPITNEFINYKPGIYGSFDIGIDMLKDETGLLLEHHYMYEYFLVPINNKKMIDFFDNQKLPFNIKNVKRI